MIRPHEARRGDKVVPGQRRSPVSTPWAPELAEYARVTRALAEKRRLREAGRRGPDAGPVAAEAGPKPRGPGTVGEAVG